MSYQRAIQTREEEVRILSEALEKANAAKDLASALELERRIQWVTETIEDLKQKLNPVRHTRRRRQ